jgi:hypothetical protein
MVGGRFKLKIPNNHGEDYSPGLIARVRRRAEISKDDWDRA